MVHFSVRCLLDVTHFSCPTLPVPASAALVACHTGGCCKINSWFGNVSDAKCLFAHIPTVEHYTSGFYVYKQKWWLNTLMRASISSLGQCVRQFQVQFSLAILYPFVFVCHHGFAMLAATLLLLHTMVLYYVVP